jgi:hypothetical protein
MIFKKGQTIRVIKDAVGDLPKSVVGRNGEVVKRLAPLDGFSFYKVKVKGYRELQVFSDEIKLV